MSSENIFNTQVFRISRKKSTHLHEQFGSREVQADDIYHCLKPILKFGQFIGICPYRNLWSEHRETFPSFRWSSLQALFHILITFFMGVNVIMNCAGMTKKVMTGKTNPIQIAWAIAPFMMYSVGFYTYIHFSKNANKLIKLFHNWREHCGQMKYVQENKSIFWKVQITTTLVLLSAVFENVVYHLRNDCSQSNCEDMALDKYDELERYYWREHGKNWADLPYNPVTTVFLFMVNKLTVIATNFSDICIYSMAWIISSKLQGFVNVITTKVNDQSICWIQTRKDYILLFTLLEEVNKFLSPVIFFSYTLLIELISTQIHLGITTDSEKSTIAQVYSIWSFLHLLVRFALISVLSSQIPERCQEIVLLLQKCPSDKFTHEVERLERLAATPQGLTGLGCFRISKPFILSVIHVIFTCEIIFLQANSSKA